MLPRNYLVTMFFIKLAFPALSLTNTQQKLFSLSEICTNILAEIHRAASEEKDGQGGGGGLNFKTTF
mgnify:CR=1 FL=1